MKNKQTKKNILSIEDKKQERAKTVVKRERDRYANTKK